MEQGLEALWIARLFLLDDSASYDEESWSAAGDCVFCREWPGHSLAPEQTAGAGRKGGLPYLGGMGCTVAQGIALTHAAAMD